MEVDRILEDPEFGHLYIKTNVRSVRYTFRPARDGGKGILITVPTCYSLNDVLRSVEEMRPKLHQLLARYEQRQHRPQQQHHIDLDFRILSDCLHVTLRQGTREGFYLHNEQAETRHNPLTSEPEIVKPAILHIICPPNCDFSSDARQQWFEKAITEGIRAHAKALLLPRLLAYAQRYGIQLKEVRINSSKGRWGSCSRKRTKGNTSLLGTLFGAKPKPTYNINLSLFTLLLPYDVQRFVLLHELMHTRHMDHSVAFHTDLDQWLDGKEKALETKLKRYSTNIFSFQNCTSK